MRAAIIALVYLAFLVLVMGESATVAGVVAAFGFALMIPLGMLLDRFRYRVQLRKWQQRYGVAPRAAAPPPTGSDAG